MIWETTPEEQDKTMNLERFKGIIKYTEQTGFDEAYLWGAEWWYWLKTKQEKPEFLGGGEEGDWGMKI